MSDGAPKPFGGVVTYWQLLKDSPLRERPSAQSRELRSVPAGSRVHVLETEGGYSKVTWGSDQGWISSPRLEEKSEKKRASRNLLGHLGNSLDKIDQGCKESLVLEALRFNIRQDQEAPEVIALIDEAPSVKEAILALGGEPFGQIGETLTHDGSRLEDIAGGLLKGDKVTVKRPGYLLADDVVRKPQVAPKTKVKETPGPEML